MEHLSFDPYIFAALLMGFVLAVCLAIMFVMRDRESTPPHMISRSVWCRERGQVATVDFVERMHTGIVLRTVQRCSARQGRCRQACRDLPASETSPAPLPSGLQLPAAAS